MKVNAGMSGTFGPDDFPGQISLEAAVGAHLTVVEAKLGSVVGGSESTCKNALFLDVDSNGGAFARAGGSIGTQSFQRGPSATTTFFAAGTTICLGNKKPTPRFIATTPEVRDGGAGAACPTTARVTESTTVSSVYTLTTCAVPEINCPPRFEQTVVATHVETIKTIKCPGVTPLPALQTPPPTVAPVAPTGMPVNLTQVPSPQVATVPAYANFTLPANATAVTGAFVAVTPPPENQGGGGDNNGPGDKKNSGIVLEAPRLWTTTAAMLAVGFVMALL